MMSLKKDPNIDEAAIAKARYQKIKMILDNEKISDKFSVKIIAQHELDSLKKSFPDVDRK